MKLIKVKVDYKFGCWQHKCMITIDNADIAIKSLELQHLDALVWCLGYYGIRHIIIDAI
jgi:hypothetical protein